MIYNREIGSDLNKDDYLEPKICSHQKKLGNAGVALICTAGVSLVSLYTNLEQHSINKSLEQKIKVLQENVAMFKGVQASDVRKDRHRFSFGNHVSTHVEIDTLETNTKRRIPTAVLYKDSYDIGADGTISNKKVIIGRYGLD